ncbi:MAG: S-layer homology domain-containing protein [Bacillota bacterium]
MNLIRKPVSLLIIAILLNGLFGGVFIEIFAAPVGSVNITVDSYMNGTLEFNWSDYPGAAAAVVAYHKPKSNDTAELVELAPILSPVRSATITGLMNDYIYDINVTIYGAVDGAGNPVGDPIGRGLLYFMPRMTFQYTTPDQPYVDLAGGGREIGSMPRLGLRWITPKIFYDPNNTVYPDTDPNPGNNVFISANSSNALAYMQNSLNLIYSGNHEISSLNFRINISTDLNLLNAGSTQASLLIDQTAGGNYTARVSGGTVTAVVSTTQSALSFELWGRADDASEVPEPPPGMDYVLPDNDILPGTVYYMNIKPIYKDSAGNNVAAVMVGDPEDQNGSMLSGERSYASTPIRFQLTKDSANNIYVKIYKVNQGSLDLPRLYYEIQATDDPSIPGDWVVKGTMDDTYFTGSFAITVISGVSPENEIFYRIVVKSDSPIDRLESPAMPYTLTVDTSRPPLPTGIMVINRVPNPGKVYLPSGVEIDVKSTDVTISWDKPLNWETVRNDLYFHFMLGTNQTPTTEDIPLYVGEHLLGNYPAVFRLVKYISAKSGKIREVGNRLEYTLDAFDLFTWEGDTESDSGTIDGYGDYPRFLLPNTVYYLQMYTTNAQNRGTADTSKMSDRSVITSFTTLDDAELEVPLPMGFALDVNGKDTAVDPPVNYISVRFDKIMNLDWDKHVTVYDPANYNYYIYYDILMSLRNDPLSFTLVGTTENPDGDIIFTGAGDPQSTSVRARISKFEEQGNVNVFGYNLLPNTIYYIKARTRLVVKSKTDPSDTYSKESVYTTVLPVTTIRLDINPPDEEARKPLAPTDFAIAVDEESGRPVVSDYSVTFSWNRRENDVIYQLIKTTQKINPTAAPEDYGSDPEYLSFLQEYDLLSDNVENGVVYLDPADSSTHPGKFTYDSATGTCTYTVDRRIFPNKVYYFSLRAVRVDSNRNPLEPASESVWVSIPVTTTLIEAPLALEAVLGAELGFYWTDDTVGLTAEDYKIYVKGPSDTNYKLMDRSRATVIKDTDGKTYYGRVRDLKADTYYDIKVVKGANTTVYDKASVKTRDACHEIEVRWIGKPLDGYSSYEIAIMEEGGAEYTVLTAADLEHYIDKAGSVLPYYPEETAQTVNNDKMCYYTKIKSANVTMPGGIVTKQPLKSNVKYYIKVRAVKVDSVDTDIIAYSKYVGPVNIRTEFSQEDYDNIDREEQERAVFLDKMEMLEKRYYWRVAIGRSRSTTILLKGAKVADAMKNSPGDSFTLDLTALSVNVASDAIYVPITVIKTMNAFKKNLVIRTEGMELVLRPATLDTSANGPLKEIMEREEVKDIYVKIDILRSVASSTPLPQENLKITGICELDIIALGLSMTDEAMAKMYHDRLYDEDTGLVSEKLNFLLNVYVGSGPGSAAMMEKYAQNLVDMIEKELSLYIDDTLQGAKINNAVARIEEPGVPVLAGMSASSSKGVKIPYALFDGSTSWQRISAGILQEGSMVRFNLVKTGKFVIMAAQTVIGGVSPGHWAKDYIEAIAARYDLNDVFPGIQSNFMPDSKATCSEVVLLYEKVTGKTAENAGLDIRQKNMKLGLSGIIHPNSLAKNIRRQETAKVLLKLFSVKKGAVMDKLKPKGRIMIADENDIGDDYFQPVVMIVDMEVMELDGGGRFRPREQMTRAEVVAAFVKLLKLTGDI